MQPTRDVLAAAPPPLPPPRRPPISSKLTLVGWGRRALGAVLLALAAGACAAASLAIRAGRAGGTAPAWWLDWVELSEEEREARTL